MHDSRFWSDLTVKYLIVTYYLLQLGELIFKLTKSRMKMKPTKKHIKLPNIRVNVQNIQEIINEKYTYIRICGSMIFKVHW